MTHGGVCMEIAKVYHETQLYQGAAEKTTVGKPQTVGSSKIAEGNSHAELAQKSNTELGAAKDLLPEKEAITAGERFSDNNELKERELLSGEEARTKSETPLGKEALAEKERLAGTERLSVNAQKDKEEAAKELSKEETVSPYDRIMAQKAMDNAKERLKSMGKSAQFAYNDDINRYTITIMDKDSKEIVKEIPSEQIQKMIEHLHTMRGMMLDEGI